MPPAGERVERLDHLVAGPGRVGERVEPDVDPRPDIAHGLVQDEAADDEEHEPDDHRAHPPRGRVQEQQEDGEEQQRRAEVALDDDDAEGDRPHRDHRREIRQRRERIRTDAVSCSTRSARFSDR